MLPELALLAVLVFQEARGEPFPGQVAVAQVVLERVQNACYPDAIKRVIRQPKQFSGIGQKGVIQTPEQARKKDPEAYRMAELAVQYALEGVKVLDGATHFHSHTVKPAWSGHAIRLKKIGNHIFYRLKSGC